MLKNSFKIVDFKKEDTSITHELFPASWNFDFYSFINHYFNQPYFKGFSIINGNNVIGFGNLLFFDHIGWLGNIVVSEEYRNLGLGTKITKFLINQGKTIGIRTFSLIATEPGIPIYKKLGFNIDQNYIFYQSGNDSKKTILPEIKIEKANKKNLHKIIDLDSEITGEKRHLLLEQLLPGIFFINNKTGNTSGVYIKNLGSGLILANDPKSGIELLKLKMLDNDPQIVVPAKNKFAIDYLEQSGYKNNNTAPRMVLGDNLKWKADSIYSRGSGYSG